MQINCFILNRIDIFAYNEKRDCEKKFAKIHENKQRTQDARHKIHVSSNLEKKTIYIKFA